MKINYLGHSSFIISGNGHDEQKVTLVTDPFDPKMLGLPYHKQDADIVTCSHEGHGDHDWYEGIKKVDEKDYFLINTPGEYEIRGVRIFGIKSFHDDKQGKERGQNTIFVFDFEEARIAHLGDLGHPLDSEQIEALEGVDILMVPVGGTFTIDSRQAVNVIEEIEPKIVIPMHYKVEGMTPAFEKLETLEDFLKEAGIDVKESEDLKIKSKSDLPQDTTYMPMSRSN